MMELNQKACLEITQGEDVLLKGAYFWELMVLTSDMALPASLRNSAMMTLPLSTATSRGVL